MQVVDLKSQLNILNQEMKKSYKEKEEVRIHVACFLGFYFVCFLSFLLLQCKYLHV